MGVRAIRWAIRQLRFEGATTCGLARQLATTWNTVWSHIKPCLQAASDDPARFAGVQVLGVDEHVWHHQDRRRREPRELTGIVDLTRGEDHPTARLSGPGPRQVWHRVQELARRGRRTVSLRYPDRDTGSLPGTARTPSTINSKTPPASWKPSISSSSLATPQVRYAAASSKTQPETAGAQATPSTQVRNLLRASRHKLTPCQQERLREDPSGAVCPAAPGCTGCFTYPVLRDTRAAHAGSYR